MRSKGKDLAPKKISNTQENEWAAYLYASIQQILFLTTTLVISIKQLRVKGKNTECR